MKTAKEWLATGRHIPPFLRDFHDQKDIFKWIWRGIAEARQRNPVDGFDYLAGMTWTGAQVFVIDYFLWFMAVHGYTLQPTYPKRGFASWSESIREMKAEDAAAFRKILDERSSAQCMSANTETPFTSDGGPK